MFSRKELITKYIDFFKSKNHVQINSSSIIPENDPTTLFISAGMHPLVPYLLGQKHPQGKRLVNLQKCLRTGDIDEVGNTTHNTFFEMLGNWSLGDYWKKESIEWCYEFLTKEIKLNPEDLYVTVFAGDESVQKDEESAQIWMSLSIPKEKIFFLGKEDNWWGPAGQTGPCGPDTEMFIDIGKEKCGTGCKPGCSCGKYVEIWNSVFMAYNKTKEGKYEPLQQKNVDTGMGVERTLFIINNFDSIYETDMFQPIVKIINELKSKENKKSERIIADHLRSSVFLLSEEIAPSNLERGYILRRLIRRAIRHANTLEMKENYLEEITKVVIDYHSVDYPELKDKGPFILSELKKEEDKFMKTLDSGLKIFQKLSESGNISGEKAFLLFQSYGFPIEMTLELAEEKRISVDEEGFKVAYEKHQQLSRVGSEQKFKGGLADDSEKTTKLHTAAHLVAEALRRVLGREIAQKGSNITIERLRFDFNFDRKLTDEEVRRVEDMVNEQIQKEVPVTKKEVSISEAREMGAQGVFDSKYGDKVFVYLVGDFSKEICGGPHVESTNGLGKFKITKQESVSAGVRRIKAILD